MKVSEFTRLCQALDDRNPNRVSENLIKPFERVDGDSMDEKSVTSDIMRSMKVAVYFGWLYRWMLDFVHELSQLVTDVRPYSMRAYGTYPWRSYESRVVMVNPQRFVPFVVNFLAYRADIAILLASETVVSLLLFALSKIARSRIVLIVEENNERSFRNVFLRVLSKLKRVLVVAVHRNADLLIAESQASAEYLLRMGCSAERVHAIPHGVNVDIFQPKEKSEELARKIGITEDEFRNGVVLFVGVYNEIKGAEYMTQAILSFPDANKPTFLLPSEGRVFLKHEEELRALTNVHTYPPLLDEMPDLYSLADIVVVPSKKCPGTSSDRSPNSCVEALACGKAVIGTNVGGIPLIMGDAGLLIPPNDPSAIIEAVSRLIEDANLRRALQKKARKRAVSVLSNQVYARRILALLEDSSRNRKQTRS
jgi:glycosyltransferase involved in cell wall biosynthesis